MSGAPEPNIPTVRHHRGLLSSPDCYPDPQHSNIPDCSEDHKQSRLELNCIIFVLFLCSQEKKSPCLSRHFLVTNSTVNHQAREKSRPLVGRREDGAELGRLGGDKPAVEGGVEEEEDCGGGQPGPGVSRQNVCVINACQVSSIRGSWPCLFL